MRLSVPAGRVPDVESGHSMIVHVREQSWIRTARTELRSPPDEPPSRRPEVMCRAMELGARIQILEAVPRIADFEAPIRVPVRPSSASVGEESVRRLAWVQPAEVVEDDLEAMAWPADCADLSVSVSAAG